MAFDTKYRPRTYNEVLGQGTTVSVLKRYVAEGRGFHQSYVFSGQHGSGKTTLARILARALLCESPVEGEPCDKCSSCVTLLNGESHECFEEVDAATRSGKEDLSRIVEDASYSTFSGKKRIWLMDECFTEDTVLLTREGFRSIRELVETKFSGEVLSCDTETGEQVWRPVTDWFDLGEREVITLEFDNGVEITVTLGQELFTTNRGWVKVEDLTDQDEVKDSSWVRSGATMTRLIRKSETFRAPVYDLTVEGTHAFYAASGPSPERGVLAHNCHRISRTSMDVLLKSMEDSVPGSEDKILVLIFCTTEPDKMVSTIFSRCAPAFVIRPTSEEDIAGRLAEVCHGEGIEYEKEALVSLAETSRSHIRDALKSLEGVSVASGGKVTNSAVRSYFKFDTNDRVLELLGSILARERSKALSVAEKVCQALGPKVAYERLSEASMAVYRANLGIPQTRSAWDKSVVDSLSQGSAGKESLEVAKFFSCPPNRVSVSSFVLDCAGFKSQTVVVQNHTPDPPREEKKDTPPPPSQKAAPEVVSEPTVNSGGVYINPKGVKHSGQKNGGYNGSHEPRQKSGSSLDRETFKKLVEVHIGGGTLECLQRKIHG